MTASSESSPRPGFRRWLAPQFSLAAAIVAITLWGVALWYFCRVPYAVESTQLMRVPLPGPHQPQQVSVRQIEHLRRVWGGKPVRHGRLQAFDQEGSVIAEEHYRDGQLHGRFARWRADGSLAILGQFKRGRPHGPWASNPSFPAASATAESLFGQFTSTWTDGVPDGRWEWRDPQGTLYLHAEFDQGKFLSSNAPDFDTRLIQLLAEGAIDDPRLLVQLFEPTTVDFVNTPIEDALLALENRIGVPVSTQDLQRPTLYAGPLRDPVAGLQGPPSDLHWPHPPRTIRQGDLPVTCRAENIPLILALGKLLQPYDLVCDYRHGVLWITQRRSETAWKDATGVSQISPAAGTPLASVWKSPTSARFVQASLDEALDALARRADDLELFERTRLPAATRQGNAPGSTVTLEAAELEYRHVLGMVLEDAGCKARLADERIIVEPQGETSPMS